MSFKLSELLNPAPASGSASNQQADLHESAPDLSPQRAVMPSFGQLPTPVPLQAAKLDLSPPHSSEVNHVAPIEPSTSLEQTSSSPTLDQYHLSPAQSHVRRHSMANAPNIPPPTLPPIQYDISPPGTMAEIAEEHKMSGHTLPRIRSVDVEPSEDDAILSVAVFDGPPTQGGDCGGQGRSVGDGPIPGCTASEKEIAALSLAALDGAQDEAQNEDEDSAVKTETQGAPGLATVPVSKAVSRVHKAPNSKPSEGSSDKRFLCYICIKLFTRRRSVRDHIKKIHNDTNFDMARAIEVTVNPETGESIIPLVELVKTLPPPTGVQPAQTNASNSVSRASSVETNTFSTPAPITGKKRPAAEMAPALASTFKKKGTAKPKPLNTSARKVKPEPDNPTEAAMVFRSPSGTPVSSRASKPPAVAKPTKQPSMSLASSPAPSDHMSLAPMTDEEMDDEGGQAYVPAEDMVETTVDNRASDDNENEIFCICRKGDNHTWMIGCDGGCEDWFHGKCVNIQERDGDLIDKYICPNCEDKGRGQTTWKRMCRRKECRKPARVLADPPSKYCTEECKERFWVGMVLRSDPNAIASEDGLKIIGSRVQQRNEGKKKKKHRKVKEDEEYNDTNNDEESDYQEGVKLSPSRRKKKSVSPIMTKGRRKDYLDEDAISSDEEPPLSTKGGQLSIGDIRMILDQAKTVEEIRQLGQKPPTPPYTSDADPDGGDAKMANTGDANKQQEQKPFPYNPEERTHLEKLSTKKRQLKDQLQLLRDQEKFLAMIRSRSAAIIDETDVPKAKNVCGFDARLSWSTAEFEEWRSTPAGTTALAKGEIGDPDPNLDPSRDDSAPEDAMADAADHDADEDDHNNDGDHEDGDDGDADADGNTKKTRGTILRGVCIRNKCPRHREWRRLMASEYKFEEEVVRRQMRKVEAESREVRERAAMRVLCEQE